MAVGDESTYRGKVLFKGVCLVVGNWKDVRYRLDDWVGVEPLCNMFPKIFMMMFNKESVVL